MGFPVCRVIVLVSFKVPGRVLFVSSLCFKESAIRAQQGIGIGKICSISQEGFLSLFADVSRNDQFDPVPFDGPDHRISNSGIA